MKNFLYALGLTLVLCGCASDNKVVPQPSPQAASPSPASTAEPSGAEMLTLFASVAPLGQTIDLDPDSPGGRSPGMGTLNERFVSARGQACARMLFTANHPAFNWPDFELVFCDGSSGWTLIPPLQRINLLGISRGSFLGFVQAGIVRSNGS